LWTLPSACSYLSWDFTTPAHLPALTRLLTDCPSLKSFEMSNFLALNGEPLFFGDSLPAFCAALQASSIKHLTLRRMHLWHSLPDGLSVLDAITGHRSLTSFICYGNQLLAASRPAVGEALGRLVAAESRLEHLDLSSCHLGDVGLRPLFEALAGNRMLSTLVCGNNYISRECARNVILPAVRANASLQKLIVGQHDIPGLAKAEHLVAARH
jgi:hypothetical protein